MKTIYHFILSGLLVSIITFFSSCGSKDLPEKSERLRLFLENGLQRPNNRHQIVVVLNAGCDPCLEKSVHFLNKINRNNKYRLIEKIVIITDDSKLYKMVSSTGVKIFRDSTFLLVKYGLQLSNNFLVEFDEDQNILYYNDMTTQTIDRLNAHYRIK